MNVISFFYSGLDDTGSDRESFLFFSLLEFFKFLLVGFFFCDGGFESSMSIVGSVDGEDRVIDQVEGSKTNKDDEHLPHESMSLKDEVQVSPHGLDCWIGVESGNHLGLAAYMKALIPKTGLMVWE